MAQERQQKREMVTTAQRVVVDQKLRALVKTLAKMAAEADYEASKAQTSHPPKGSSS